MLLYATSRSSASRSSPAPARSAPAAGDGEGEEDGLTAASRATRDAHESSEAFQ